MAFLPKFRNNKFLDIALLSFIFLVCFDPRLLEIWDWVSMADPDLVDKCSNYKLMREKRYNF